MFTFKFKRASQSKNNESKVGVKYPNVNAFVAR